MQGSYKNESIADLIINLHAFLEIAEEFLKEFTIAYNTAYGVEYTKTTLKEIDAESFAEEKPTFQLLQRSVSKNAQFVISEFLPRAKTN